MKRKRSGDCSQPSDGNDNLASGPASLTTVSVQSARAFASAYPAGSATDSRRLLPGPGASRNRNIIATAVTVTKMIPTKMICSADIVSLLVGWLHADLDDLAHPKRAERH